jgi:ABC-2 type transport system permease protein
VHNIATIARRELSSSFNSLLAYVVLVVFLLVAGWMCFGPLFLYGRADMRNFFAPSLFSPSVLFVILAPALTMRLIAEERKSKTIELLTTTPITDAEVVVGKFLGAFGLVLIALAATLVYAVTIRLLGPLDLGEVAAGYLGFILFSASMLSIGVLLSTLTDSQIVAFVLGFLVCGALYLIYWLRLFSPPVLGPFFEFVSTSYHLDNLARGVVDTRDVVYYLTVTGGGLYLSTLSLARQHA